MALKMYLILLGKTWMVGIGKFEKESPKRPIKLDDKFGSPD
jgi:hypothetical protein